MEALERLRFESFVREGSHISASIGKLLDSMVDKFPDGQSMDFLENTQVEDAFEQY